MFENPATVCNRQVENKNYFIKVGKGVIRKDMMNKNPHQLAFSQVGPIDEGFCKYILT